MDSAYIGDGWSNRERALETVYDWITVAMSEIEKRLAEVEGNP